ncbi:DoxX family membrane protein [Opitutus sp. GAS368]|uniref:DoxX family protein n=1 Tax=Opitutus sp. GAS368 TaxID=1882749 RepID=UPI000B84A44C|nr:DoxX family membrane protein [Opitutus sp. GAS368]
MEEIPPSPIAHLEHPLCTLRSSFRSLGPWLVGVFFVLTGANHFMNSAPYLAMMPPWLPAPGLLVIVSGIAEVAGGIGVLIPSLRRAAAWSLIVLLLAVFPANLHVALQGWPGVDLPAWSLWLRLPLQPLMIWAVHRSCLTRPKP